MEEGCSRNLTVKLDGGGALATWPATRQQGGGGTSFGGKANGARRSKTRSGTRCGEVLWYEGGLL
jgi:hypothetical protein